MKALQTWFARQSLTVKLLVTVPFLALAILWSAVPDGGTPPPSAAPTNRPVLASGTPVAVATLAPHEEPRAVESGLTWVAALRTIVSVGIVLGLIVAAARGLKYFMATTGQLPGTGGSLKVLETIKSDPALSGIPVVVITAWNSTEDKVRALSLIHI